MNLLWVWPSDPFDRPLTFETKAAWDEVSLETKRSTATKPDILRSIIFFSLILDGTQLRSSAGISRVIKS